MSYKNKEQQAEYARKHYAENKEAYRLSSLLSRKNLAREIYEYKASNPCVDCGNLYPSYVMDFDHIGLNKIANVSKLVAMGSGTRAWEEISKCELVCANCHRVRTHRRRNRLTA